MKAQTQLIRDLLMLVADIEASYDEVESAEMRKLLRKRLEEAEALIAELEAKL